MVKKIWKSFPQFKTNANRQWDKRYCNVIRSLENRGNLLKATPREISFQKGGFLRRLISAGLPLIKKVLTLLAKQVLITLGLMAAT